MKNFLFILGLLISFMLFAPEEGTKSMDEVMSATKEAVMKEKNTADAQRRFEVLSNELKSSNCLTPRRISQTTNNTIEIRIWKNMEKSLQDMRLRGVNQLHRVSQHISTYQKFIHTSVSYGRACLCPTKTHYLVFNCFIFVSFGKSLICLIGRNIAFIKSIFPGSYCPFTLL